MTIIIESRNHAVVCFFEFWKEDTRYQTKPLCNSYLQLHACLICLFLSSPVSLYNIHGNLPKIYKWNFCVSFKVYKNIIMTKVGHTKIHFSCYSLSKSGQRWLKKSIKPKQMYTVSKITCELWHGSSEISWSIMGILPKKRCIIIASFPVIFFGIHRQKWTSS